MVAESVLMSVTSAEAEAYRGVVDVVYQKTRVAFDGWATDPKYKPYVIPESTAPKTGFAIFYTSPAFQPTLLIIGQNPANFAAAGRSLKDYTNAEMLSGSPPS
jgi:hypothetical protein